ncbi:dihydrolipoamide acetyltransferase family protein [Anaeromyxobacter diazotrophicus]|uniref:Dihydrolipoamide acetyltransferase component of pyruvate dehydrogenase complex n=1 Tax=Anaeromyxobacter diazotrophicus TaxID=2590199 RepID=A0A7I9VLQ5_9BACT|nr:dihydrolipoamide acetyltransferase family protein [Anaeromyxobacter diazotrophicus]GEJ57342.1 dihydrolipoamide acetyltransferase component of pyruvate dehydrogenase complex [Anaeromyxobacter diazotrophicus]
MTFKFILPDIGEGVVEAEVQQWFVKPGDHVVEDQPLVEVMTDKATVTLPSPRRGTVTKLLHQPGQVAKVHEPLLELVEDVKPSQEPSVMAPAQEEAAPAQEAGAAPPAAPAERSGRKVLAAPAVRAMARQLGVDLGLVHGSGPGGRVLKDDVHGARNGHAHPPPELTAPAAVPQRPAPFAEQLPEQAPVKQVSHGDEVVPVRGIRRRIAERMAQSKRTAAHFTFVEQVDVSDLVKVKDRIAAKAREEGVKVTFLPFIVKAVVAALKKHPWLNAVLDEARGEIRLRREYHIGIASATEHGLTVPVVRHADKLSLMALAREIERLAAETKAGKVRPEDLSGSTFTITSLGAQGGLFATPIINFPEVGILGVHRIRPTPVVKDGQIVARDIMNVSLSFDHRVVDGHVGAAFAYTVIGYLEEPDLLFMDMV